MNAPAQITGSVVASGTLIAIAVQEVVTGTTAGRSTEDIIQIVGVVSGAVIAVSTVIGGIVVQIISARMKVAVANAVAPVALAVAEVKAQGDTIKHSVDGTASRMEATLAAAMAENQRLREDKVDQKEIIIAQATPAAVPAKKPKR